MTSPVHVSRRDVAQHVPEIRWTLDISGELALALVRLIGRTTPEQRSVEMEIPDKANLEVEELFNQLVGMKPLSPSP